MSHEEPAQNMFSTRHRHQEGLAPPPPLSSATIAKLVPALLATTAVPAATFAPPAGPPRTAPLRSDVASGENADLA